MLLKLTSARLICRRNRPKSWTKKRRERRERKRRRKRRRRGKGQKHRQTTRAAGRTRRRRRKRRRRHLRLNFTNVSKEQRFKKLDRLLIFYKMSLFIKRAMYLFGVYTSCGNVCEIETLGSIFWRVIPESDDGPATLPLLLRAVHPPTPTRSRAGPDPVHTPALAPTPSTLAAAVLRPQFESNSVSVHESAATAERGIELSSEPRPSLNVINNRDAVIR